MKKKKRHILIYASIVLVLIIAASAVVLFPVSRLHDTTDDLVEKVNSGQAVSVAEFKSLLGSPYNRTFTGWDVAFHLGSDGSYSQIDSKWCVLRLDTSNRDRVVAAKIIVD